MFFWVSDRRANERGRQFNDFIRYYGGFVQDDFRVTPKLTLNLGLRFEYESGIQEENNS